MAAPSGLLCLVLAIAIAAGVVEAGPRKVKRQTNVDTSHIADDELIACFAALAEGRECFSLTENNITPAPEIAAPGCRCVPRWQCLDSTGPSVDTPDGILTLVNVRTTCADPFHTCCLNINNNAVPPTIPAPPPTGPSSLVQACGQLQPQGVANTLLGFEENQAQFGQFPWMAAVVTTGVAGSNGANVYVSGGSLIHPRVVMTAAHYMQGKRAEGLAVRLGEWNFKLPTEPIPHQDIRVRSISIHPDFVANLLAYDVALLVLEKDAVLGPTVGTVCLPDPFETFDGSLCYGSGWGKDIFGQPGKYQQILKSVKLPAVSHNDCQNAFRRTHLGNTFNLHRTFMCAGGQPGVDLCTGDGGSPLVCPKNIGGVTSYAQAGIVAWGIGCGGDGIPGAYASVSEAMDWIQQQLAAASFDIRIE